MQRSVNTKIERSSDTYRLASLFACVVDEVPAELVEVVVFCEELGSR